MSFDPEQPFQRKTQESIRHSKSLLHDTKDAGVAILEKIRNQGERLRHSNDRLTPIAGMSGEAGKLLNNIFGSLGSDRRLFVVLAVLTIIILFLVIRWKRS